MSGYDLSTVSNGFSFSTVENSIVDEQRGADNKADKDSDVRAKSFRHIIPVFVQRRLFTRTVLLNPCFDGGTEVVACDDVEGDLSNKNICHREGEEGKVTDSDDTTRLDQETGRSIL
ncbi:hypothetical protein K435DRAFT_316051 [Dendrothele bispora CBS 962.96]|uniref:Uncharacterized protein n=1 Tax=Dendrothele bispora (strain CBS 962.96) TaxID=1314807 RepID=A0A4S8MJE6_DENBC|nr:hypothetical protein K435DRAFT_316051 [Dendrothele bispora CBS 962.96]